MCEVLRNSLIHNPNRLRLLHGTSLANSLAAAGTGVGRCTLLSIREDSRDHRSVTLRLDGKLRGEWLSELEHQCSHHALRGRAIVLDVAGVQFVDSEGIALLRRLRQGGASIVNRSLFLDLLLKDDVPPDGNPLASGASKNV